MIIDTPTKSELMDYMQGDFSYEAKDALIDYMEQLSEDIGEDIKFDRVAWRCEYSEYDNFAQFLEDYSHMKEDIRDYVINEGSIFDLIELGKDPNKCKEIAMGFLEDYTMVIDIPNTDKFLIQQF